MTRSKKHHFNPQSVLRRFSVDGQGKKIWIYDKKEGRSYQSSVRDAGAENNFNVVEANGTQHNLEDVFQEIDALGANSISRLHETRAMHELTPEEAGALVAFLAAQILRVKMVRTSLTQTSEQILRSALGAEKASEAASSVMSDNNARRASFQFLFGEVREKIVSELVKKVAVLLETDSAPLWTSDNPVALFNPFSTGLMGLASPGIQIFLPIGSDLCLAFFDPSSQRIGSDHSPQGEPAPDPWTLIQFYSERESGPVRISAKQANFLNQLQVGRSSRFLYSSVPDFSLAEEYIKQMPAAAEIESLVSVGFPGRPKEFQEDRDYVAFHGPKGSFEIEVEDLVLESVGFRFSFPNRTKLEEISSAAPFQQAQSFGRHGKSVGLSGSLLEILPVVDSNGRWQARVVYEDSALNNSMKKIDADRPA